MVAEIFSRARATGAKVLFDIDDLMFKPELATISIIDGIRSLGHDAASVAMMFQSIQKVAAHADACICTTEELAHHMREFNPITFVLPNGFDAAALSTSRRAVRRCGRDSDGLVRLGYATGTRTHQADFRVAADAIGRILRERPQCRLVLFRDPAYQTPIMDAAEFPAMAGLDGQIEWRDAVSLWDLPNELARFDINLARWRLAIRSARQRASSSISRLPWSKCAPSHRPPIRCGSQSMMARPDGSRRPRMPGMLRCWNWWMIPRCAGLWRTPRIWMCCGSSVRSAGWLP